MRRRLRERSGPTVVVFAANDIGAHRGVPHAMAAHASAVVAGVAIGGRPNRVSDWRAIGGRRPVVPAIAIAITIVVAGDVDRVPGIGRAPAVRRTPGIGPVSPIGDRIGPTAPAVPKVPVRARRIADRPVEGEPEPDGPEEVVEVKAEAVTVEATAPAEVAAAPAAVYRRVRKRAPAAEAVRRQGRAPGAERGPRSAKARTSRR